MTMRMPKTLVVVASTVIVTAALVSGVSAAVLAPAAAPTTTYYGCLNAGTLSQVGTTAPTCTSPAVRISWLSASSTDTKAQVAAAITAANGVSCAVPAGGTAGVDWHGCNLSGQTLSGDNLSGANLKGADLSGALLNSANLTNANLWGANLVGATLTGATLTGANLTGADLSGVDLSAAVIGATGFTTALNGANLTNAVYTGATITGASFLNADLSGAGLSTATWLNATCPDGVNSDTIGHTCVGHESPLTAAVRAANTCSIATLCWPAVLNYSGGSYGFNSPQRIASDGSHLWVANTNGNSVTELDASDGSWVRTLSGGSYGFVDPYGIAFDGSHLWVANYQRQLGHRAQRVRRQLGAHPLGRLLRVQRSLRGRLRRHPSLGDELQRRLGHRAQRLRRQLGADPLGRLLRVQPAPTRSPSTAPISG